MQNLKLVICREELDGKPQGNAYQKYILGAATCEHANKS